MSIQPNDIVQAVSIDQCPYRDYHIFGYNDETATGKVFRVSAVLPSDEDYPGIPAWLVLYGKPYEYCIGCFKKIGPAQEEFTEIVRACRPIKQRELV